MEKFQTLIQIIFGCTSIYFAIRFFIDKRRDIKNIADKISAETEQTNDLKIESYVYRYVVLNFGTEFNYCKFYFFEDEIYLYCRFTYPKNFYQAPFILKYKDENDYSYFSKFIVTKFIQSGNDLKIQFKNKNLIGTNLTLYIVDIPENDKKILIEKFK
ncbi:hypothetical protein [Flavobacterium sp.]|uniref:hypothetical protein n=1 Tax=Flavobacterium sp. TaxID=239 RepID=UPI00260D0785|nr:hypothetical protein [Flavobacterium sp.]MDG2432137.1 hypothetical protein [Flavobacterium sp.]